MSRGRATRAHAHIGGWAIACAAALVGATLAPVQADHPDDASETALHLVTLDGPGTTGHRGNAGHGELVERMQHQQEELLDLVDAPEPVYQWTTALNGFAVELDADQAQVLASDPRVTRVEENEVRRLSTLTPAAEAPHAAASAPAAGRGGAGTVIGFVDSGIDPDNRAFSDAAPLGAEPRFRGECTGAAGDTTWSASACGAKVVGAQYFVAGYGADNVRSGDSISPRDTNGHGTQMASIAAGSRGVPITVAGDRFGSNSGAAPRARVAAYKACWSAPDPAADGCATADLVAAIDQATADRVDVLNLAVGGPNGVDTVELALLGATEAGVVVVAAAGNDGVDSFAAHPSPWVITVGATTGPARTGTVTAGDLALRGRMAADATIGEAPLVYAADAAAPGVAPADARVCRAGSLDARVAADAVVVCERGENGRVTKSRAVRRADGVGMILVNTHRDGSRDADLHSVPTVHLSADAGRRLARWAGAQEDPRVTLASDGVVHREPRMADFSSIGNPRGTVLKPDVVAPGTEVLSAVPGGWDMATGTSTSAARVSGVAAVMLGKPGGNPATVRSALLSTARPVAGADNGQAGSGQVTRTAPPPISYVVPQRHYRAWLDERRDELNQAHALIGPREAEVTRTLTNTGDRIIHITAATEGFSEPVRVFPSWAELAPGDTLTYTLTLTDAASIQQGSVVWRTGRGEEARLTVVATR